MKKIVIGILAVAAILAAAWLFLNNRNRTLSPPGSAQLTNGNLSVTISYSRPSVRGRLIFGTKEQGALQPYGAYWRLGANEATEITFNEDVTFNGNPLKAKTYRVYAVPGEKEFDIIVNTDLGRWGAFEPNHASDTLTTKVAVQRVSLLEQYTVNLVTAENGIDVSFEWADVKLVVPVRPK